MSRILTILFCVLAACSRPTSQSTIPTLESTPIATPTPESPPDKTTVNVHYGNCSGITDYSKVASEMRGTLTANQENLGYRLEGKASINSLPPHETEFKILPPPGIGDHLPSHITFFQKVSVTDWMEIKQIDLPPWLSVEHCGYDVQFTIVEPGGVRITGKVRVYVWSTESEVWH